MPGFATFRTCRRILAVLCCHIALTSVPPALALEKATVQLKWLHHFQFAGYYAAQEKGFYREAGLDVTLLEGGPSTEVEKEVAEGRADFGVGTAALMLDCARGKDFIVLGQIFQHSPAVFLTPRSSGIRSIDDMAGRKFMYSNQHGDILALLKQHGINENGITKVPHKGDPLDLLNGKAEVMIAYSFNEPFVLEQRGEPYLLFSPFSHGFDFYGDNFFTTRQLIDNHPKFVQAFREATLRGWRYALANKSEIADLILAKYSKERSKEWLMFEANQVEALIQPALVELGYQSPSRWQNISETFVGLGMLPREFDPAAIVYNPAPQNNYRLLLGIILVSSSIIAVLTYLNVKFQRLNSRLCAEVKERTQAEDALAASERKYAGILDLMPDMIGITCRADGSFLEVNKGFETWTGWTREEAIGRTSVELGLWEGSVRARAIEMVKEDGCLRNFEFVLTTRSGAKRHALMYLVPIVLGGTEKLCFMVRDITERKALELRREEDQRFLQTILDSIHDLVFYKDINSIYLGCNDAYASRYIGVPKERIIGRTDIDFVPDPDLVRKYVESDRKVMESGRSQQIKNRITMADGQKISVEVLKTPFYDASGQVSGVIGVARDMTQHQRALDSITREKETAQRYLDIAGVMFCALNRAGEIILMNKKGSQILGYGEGELLGRNWFDACLPLAVREEVKGVFALQLSGDLASVEFYENAIIDRNGRERMIAFHNTLMHDEEGVCGVLFSGEDVTDQRMLQEERHKNQKLESLGVLAGGIAHDFNNILAAIMGNISFAKLDMDEAQDAYIPLTRAEKAAQRAADLARQLLVFSKGGQPVKRVASLENIIHEAVSLALSGTNVKGLIDIPAPLEAARVDEGQINQSFHNIIINAVHAMPGGGSLTVHGENVTLNRENMLGLHAGNYVKLSFTDEGCGISEADQEKVFDPYFTTKAGGTGLGLASTHAIIHKHDGQVKVASIVGKGTTFTIYLPSLGKTRIDPVPIRTSALEGHEGGSILVMDDDEMVRDLVFLALNRIGYTVKTCSNGDEAICLYRSAQDTGKAFSAVLMDLTIPGGMGGVEAARRILALDPGTRLIVSSGYSDDPVMANYSQYGFCAAIGKPYRVEDIAATLRKVKKPPTETPEPQNMKLNYGKA